MSREEAYRLVRESGGEVTSGVSRHTTFLVVGMGGWPLLPDGMVSSKLERAEELIRRGHGLRIISEESFLGLAGHRNRQSPSSPKTYPAEDVCRLLKISHQTLSLWEQFGLVCSQAGLYDFQDLVSLRTIAELVGRGARPETIATSLQSLASVLPGTGRPLAQLKIVVDNPRALLVDLGETLITPSGQLLMDFDGRPRSEGTVVPLDHERSVEEWFEFGQACEEVENYPEAAKAYHNATKVAGRLPEAWFNLGNVLRLQQQPRAAMEAYQKAIDEDPRMACAWYNLADVQEELGNVGESAASLHKALEVLPSYADAHFNLALCYEKLERKAAAKRHWAAYLKFDTTSQWAKIARGHLSEG